MAVHAKHAMPITIPTPIKTIRTAQKRSATKKGPGSKPLSGGTVSDVMAAATAVVFAKTVSQKKASARNFMDSNLVKLVGHFGFGQVKKTLDEIVKRINIPTSLYVQSHSFN